MIETLHEFHFLRPWWLLALLLLPLLLRALRQFGSAGDAWRNVVDAHLLEYLIERDTNTATGLPRGLIAICWVITALALAGPAWERLPQPLFQNRAAHVIALELAPSMLAGDLKPSRLERARYKISDLLKRGSDGQFALLAYAGDAFVVAPLTDDANTVANLLEPLDPGVMPVPGNDTAHAIDRAVKLIHQAGLKTGDVVLFADSASSNGVDAAKRALASGVRISVLAVGTEQGAPVALPRGGFLQDANGNVVIPKLQIAELQALASAGGGRYAALSVDSADLDALLGAHDGAAAGDSDASITDAVSPRFQDRGPWLLLLLVPLCALGFRRGWLLILPLLLTLHSTPSQAMGWADLWQRPDQQAAEQLKAGDAKSAQALAQDPALRGAAAYRAGDYERAAQSFQAAGSADAQYNLGNTLASQKHYEEALAAYDAALKQQPGMADAEKNQQAIKAWLEKQKQKQQQDKNQQGQKDSKDHQGKDQQDGGKGDSQSSPQDKSQATNKDQQSGADKDAQQKSDDAQQDQQQKSGDDAQDQKEKSEAEKKKSGAAKNDKSADEKSGDEKDGAQQGDKQSADAKAADEKQKQQQYKQAMDKALQQGEPGQQQKDGKPAAVREEIAPTEKEQAMQQWLERIPDDPGGLLRRKFQLEYQRRVQGGDKEQHP
ncbi:VWA domain-containing protein [Pseudolysobacter antarcticus]|uniref:VWA domain-containing protein n=1 Tax=Pseudolysobacter antarcticus TaxID=2511995 RepID=A0A411HNC4_9GAMM|nr:VWA domain-containing protein [Pseudolysobacter antarcticus]QBB71987.1 VWA domain-containing protein [Pseudolysobacter antarcticus]